MAARTRRTTSSPGRISSSPSPGVVGAHFRDAVGVAWAATCRAASWCFGFRLDLLPRLPRRSRDGAHAAPARHAVRLRGSHRHLAQAARAGDHPATDRPSVGRNQARRTRGRAQAELQGRSSIDCSARRPSLPSGGRRRRQRSAGRIARRQGGADRVCAAPGREVRSARSDGSGDRRPERPGEAPSRGAIARREPDATCAEHTGSTERVSLLRQSSTPSRRLSRSQFAVLDSHVRRTMAAIMTR